MNEKKERIKFKKKTHTNAKKKHVTTKSTDKKKQKLGKIVTLTTTK